jgi:hypothetical protein
MISPVDVPGVTVSTSKRKWTTQRCFGNGARLKDRETVQKKGALKTRIHAFHASAARR